MKKWNQKVTRTLSLLRLMLYGTNNLLIRVLSARGGFGKLISPLSEIIEKKGWDFFYKHKAPGFAAMAR